MKLTKRETEVLKLIAIFDCSLDSGVIGNIWG